MSKFKVGDRVRVIGCDRDPSDIGKVTTVVAIANDGTYLYSDCETDNGCFVDLKAGPLAPTRSGYALYDDKNLEPIYDGNEKVSWSECAWRPKSITVC